MKSCFKHRFSFFLGYILFLIFSLVLNGCGFHLRGKTDFDFSLVHIKSDAADKVAQEVKQRLLDEGVQVVPTANAAQIVIHLERESVENRVLTVSSVSGKLEEIELNFRVDLNVHKPDGTVLLEKQRFSLLRDYSFDEKAVLAMWTEGEVLREEMFRDIVTQIMRRLRILKVGKIQLSQLAFEGLKSQYKVGEPFGVDLVEATERTIPVDIWVSLTVGKQRFFVTPSVDKEQPWQIHQIPKPWQREIAVTQTRHQLFDFIVQADMVGEYILQAVYTQAGTDFDLDNLETIMRSNLAESKMSIKEVAGK
jgi:LPS-assembly lipoprotein